MTTTTAATTATATEIPNEVEQPKASPPGANRPRPEWLRLRRRLSMPRRRRAARTVRPLAVAGLWLVVAVGGIALVVYGLGPLLEQRAQLRLLDRYRVELRDASVATPSLGGTAPVVSPPPRTGAPVGIIEIGALHLQQAVAEGASPAVTEKGPGHVPGTAGLGQPGNAVVVGRRAGFGGPFGHVGDLRPGDPILVTTTQGQSVYRVTSVTTTKAVTGKGAGSPYAPTQVSRLTLVTSGSGGPWNQERATIVVAALEGKPYAPTAQARSAHLASGGGVQPWAWPAVLGGLAAFALLAWGGVVLRRRSSALVAYLIATAPLLALTVVLGELAIRGLPAWL